MLIPKYFSKYLHLYIMFKTNALHKCSYFVFYNFERVILVYIILIIIFNKNSANKMRCKKIVFSIVLLYIKQKKISITVY